MTSLYLQEPNARMEKEYDRIIITVEGEVINAIPINKLTEIIVIGNCGITTQALLALLDNRVNLTFVSRSGKIRGRLQSYLGKLPQTPLAQYTKQQSPEFSLLLSRQIVIGKLDNYEVMMRRLIRKSLVDGDENRAVENASLGENRNLADEMDPLKIKVQKAVTLEEIRGLEGYGSKLYFQVFFASLTEETGLIIKRRQKRPPKDPINSMLSLGYTLLCQSVLTAIVISGLDPTIGFFHANRDGRPSLAMDLMKEFRTIIVDSMVIRLVNQKIVNKQHFFTNEDGAIRFTKEGMRLFIANYQKRISAKVNFPGINKKQEYRQCFELQARKLYDFINDNTEVYSPFTWR